VAKKSAKVKQKMAKIDFFASKTGLVFIFDKEFRLRHAVYQKISFSNPGILCRFNFSVLGLLSVHSWVY